MSFLYQYLFLILLHVCSIFNLLHLLLHALISWSIEHKALPSFSSPSFAISFIQLDSIFLSLTPLSFFSLHLLWFSIKITSILPLYLVISSLLWSHESKRYAQLIESFQMVSLTDSSLFARPYHLHSFFDSSLVVHLDRSSTKLLWVRDY